MKIKARVLTLLIIFFLSACTKVPITGRKQLNMLPEYTLIDMSLTNYRAFLKEHPPVPASAIETQMVKNVGSRIASAVGKYMKSKGFGNKIKDYKWEFNLVNDKAANAWCMSGGKVVVYTGLLPITQDETALAVVMGHEIAHAIARHGNERMSQQLLVQLGGMGLAVALQEKPKQTQDIFLLSYGVGSALGILKYSRTHESEADKLGLVFMAMAGYNPQEAVPFWQRMAKKSGSPNVPEIFSTHPSDETRIKDLKAFLPTAMKYYSGAQISSK